MRILEQDVSKVSESDVHTDGRGAIAARNVFTKFFAFFALICTVSRVNIRNYDE